MQDWLQWIAGVFAVGLPWISRLQNLDCHFKIGLAGSGKTFDTKDLFNACASVFSIPIYLFYVVPAAPQDFLIEPGWVTPFVCSIIAFVAFFYVFLRYARVVEEGRARWPVVINLILYLAVFLLLTIVFGYLATLQNYRLIRGTVVELTELRGLSNATVTLEVRHKGQDGEETKSEQIERTTGPDGRFMVVIDKAKAVVQLNVAKTGYKPQSLPMSSEREISVHVRLEPEKSPYTSRPADEETTPKFRGKSAKDAKAS
jgi:hypothetical protein